ncbi:MAG: phosphoenolpyruvate synthase [Pseudomonadota bacterium]
MSTKNVVWMDQVGMKDVPQVGGKNASLGEMITHLTKLGLRIPMGFVTTADAYRDFLNENHLVEKMNALLTKLDTGDVSALEKAGQQIRQWIIDATFSPALEKDIREAYKKLTERSEQKEMAVAVRSSATAEDLPNASFAGQQETYLNVRGIEDVLLSIKKVFASLYNDRAISYRVHNGFEHSQVALSAGIQYMVRSDKACSGVLFTLDTESGFREVVFITGSYGLGETVVQGSVSPDEYIMYKPNLKSSKPAILSKKLGGKAIKMIYADTGSKEFVKTLEVPKKERSQFVLTDEELHELGKMAVIIEEHYKWPMDIEWAKDGVNGKLYIVQARPETVKSQANKHELKTYRLKKRGKVIIEGRSVGELIGKGKAKVLLSIKEMSKVQEGDVLVTDMTDPDWEPIMKKASAIVTNRGGRTCHAAIIARELGIPAVVGCGNATTKIKDGQDVTVSCAEGDTGYVYEGLLDFDVETINIEKMPELPLKIMMNLANPECAFTFQFIPNAGVGLARLEFIINNMIAVHPKALIHFNKLEGELKAKIEEKIAGYKSPIDFYVEKLKEGVGTIAAAFYPKPVIVRTSDFKSNEYANLLGGKDFEPTEENPMIGFRGASRYVGEAFRDCFELECRALRELRDDMGFTNIEIMIPFVRTVEEGKNVLNILAKNNLKQGQNGLKVIMMCEIPSNAVLAEEFLKHFDGFSIGSNDLTQLTLGLDRDSSLVANLFDERNAAVKFFLERAITTCNKLNKYIGICGQGPSDYPEFAEWLLEQGIGSMSLNPDTIVKTWLYIAKHYSKS